MARYTVFPGINQSRLGGSLLESALVLKIRSALLSAQGILAYLPEICVTYEDGLTVRMCWKMHRS